MARRLTRHNGRANKNGVYKAEHNDRRFDLENADHINPEMTKFNVYWDCYNGITNEEQRKADGDKIISFSDGEKMFYTGRYADYLLGQHERNEKARHTERDRSVEDILADKRFCPEETIYQLGTLEDHADPATLLTIVTEFIGEMDRRFGDNIHVLNWSLHMDEGTPHIHERHVFDYENRYREVQPGQEKALEVLGFELPNPDKKPSKHNSRKMVFDAACRTMIFDIAKRHGVQLEEEPAYGGRAYLEKQDYILMKQKQLLAEQTEALKEVTHKLEDTEALLDQVADIAYEKAVEVVTDTVRAETQSYDLEVIEDFRKDITARNKDKPQFVKVLNDTITALGKKLKASALSITRRITDALHDPKVKQAGKEEIKKSTKASIHELLKRAQADADAYNAAREKPDRKRNNEMDR